MRRPLGEISIADAAQALGVSYGTCRNMILDKRLRGGKRGPPGHAHWFVDPESLAKFTPPRQ